MSAVTERDTESLQRRHAVVVHADVADFSRLMADDEPATVATIRRYERVVATEVGAAGGTLVNFVGDSFAAVFDDAYAALRAATAICAAVDAHNRGLPRTRQTWFRVGIDAGPLVVATDGSWFGEALNVAARVQSIADVGGINVTEAVYRALDEPALRLVSVGARRLKNIPEPVRVFRLVGMGPQHAGRATRPVRSPTMALRPTRFTGAGVDSAVAEALHLDLRATLDDIPGLTVLDDDNDDALPLRLADVAYALDTHVVASGDDVRIYASLGEMDTVNRVWAGRWEGSADDLFGLQDTVGADVRRAVEIELVIGQSARLYHEELDAAARDAVYRGWQQLMSGSEDGWRSAKALFARVIDMRPESVTGHALLAFACWLGAIEGHAPSPAAENAEAARHAARGVELDDPTGLSHTVVAALLLRGDEDLDTALAVAEQALVRRPICDVSFGVLGSVRRYLGEWHSAVQACDRAIGLSAVGRPWYLVVQASAYYVGERYHEAAEVAERVVEQDPGAREALLVLAASQQALGLERRARATAVALRDRFPELRRADLGGLHPFRDPAILARLDRHLAAAGMP